jgi:hypothetical protein
MHSIEPWRLRQLCHELLVEVFAVVKGTDTAAAMSGEPGLRIEGVYPTDLPTTAPGGWTGHAKLAIEI